MRSSSRGSPASSASLATALMRCTSSLTETTPRAGPGVHAHIPLERQLTRGLPIGPDSHKRCFLPERLEDIDRVANLLEQVSAAGLELLDQVVQAFAHESGVLRRGRERR